MSASATLTFLGTGSSQGIPVIGCDCEVCQSDDPRDQRLRTSVLLCVNDKTIVIDTGPDFRQQLLRHRVKTVDAILYTHYHKDHTAGMDDIRAINYRTKRPMDIYATDEVQQALKKEFDYVFAEKSYPGVPQVNLHLLTEQPLSLFGTTLLPIDAMHYKMPVKGFRIGQLTYITDASYIAPEEIEKIKGSTFLILNALRQTPHIAHFSLKQALELIHAIQPQQAWLTHVSHLMGRHAAVEKTLPPSVGIAHDGLQFSFLHR